MIFGPVGEWLSPGPVHTAVDPQVEKAWRRPWMAAVRDCGQPGLLVDLPSKRILQVSRAAVDQFGLDLGDAARIEALVASAGETPLLDLLADGAMETVHARRAIRTSPSSSVEAWCWGRAVHGPSGAVMAL